MALGQVAAPCQVMNCGDIVYRSTLDPSLYKNGGFDWRTGTLLATVLGYLFLPPGVLPGAIDYYVKAPLKRKESKAIDKNDIILGKRLGTGGFGTVFKGELKEEGGAKTPIIIKKAKEFGEAEVWMNERMSRVPGNHVAEFVTAFDEALNVPMPAAAGARSRPAGSPAPPVWGQGNPLENPNSIWLVWYYEGDNTLSSLMEMVFPHLRSDNNIIAFNKRLQELKWNLDAWRAEEQAKLDSGGAKAALADSLAAGFEALAADGGAGWDLVSRLLAYTPTDRPSAAEALQHPWLTSAPGRTASLQRSLAGSVEATVSTAAAATTAALSSAGRTIGRTAAFADMEEAILKSQQGALTEAQLMEELGLSERAPVAPREGSQTIAWWQERQNDLRERLVERREKLAAQVGNAFSSVRGGKGVKPAAGKAAAPPARGAEAAAAAAAAAAAKKADGSGKVKVPLILGGAKKAGSGGNGKAAAPAAAANGNGNGKVVPAANGNGNGKAVAAANVNGRSASPAPSKPNGNGNGNGLSFGLGLGRGLGRAAAANGNGNANGNGKANGNSYVEEGEEEEEEVVAEKQSTKEKVFDLLGVFRR
ncbi:hypothetical protein GPECTOR_5g144 [Gonium pectorale]|uniref:Protein kinase domain-containing protein n=1 Tax=Gonium pectorale TaxID=33097 RepID=A0A150GW71_GONPE|nr:hypothetical protein GPECTOR_5g144 [Gonium pectorale]|eukprot:KXZ54035.1 hypothetical protein GPECTOR_5g144 [Gonium pectorale]